MKKRKLKNLDLKKAVISEVGTFKSIGGRGLPSEYENWEELNDGDHETAWMSLPYSDCC